MNETFSLVLLVVLLILSGFFSGSETALISMTRLRLRKAREKYGERARRLDAWEHRSSVLLTTLLIGNNLVNIAAASVAALVISEHISNPTVAVWVNTAVMTSIILLVSEILPKQVAKSRYEPIALAVVTPLFWLGRLLAPLVWIFGGIANGIAHWMGVTEAVQLTERADVEAVVGAAGDEGGLARDERFLLEEALDLDESRVREIMTPRLSMFNVHRDTPVSELKRAIARTGYSRLPVEGDQEDIVGVVIAKDLLMVHEAETANTPLVAGDVMRRAVFVPEVVSLKMVLERFRTEQLHIAIVVGEYGEVVGLVTMEDVLEKLVGSIEDEHDAVRTDIRQVSDRRHLVDGSVRLDDLRRVVDIDLPEGEYDTIGGYFIARLGRIPTLGVAIRWDKWLIQAHDVDERRIRTVTLYDVSVQSRSDVDESTDTRDRNG
jgi:putative hemolysin